MVSGPNDPRKNNTASGNHISHGPWSNLSSGSHRRRVRCHKKNGVPRPLTDAVTLRPSSETLGSLQIKFEPEGERKRRPITHWSSSPNLLASETLDYEYMEYL